MSAKPARTRVTRFGRWDVLIVGYAALAAFCRPLTVPAVVAVLLAGGTLIVLAVRRQAAPRYAGQREATDPEAAGSRRFLIPWIVLAALLVGWELIALFWGNDSAHPTLSLLLDPVLDTYPGRFIGYLAWLSAGRWLVTR